MPSEPPDRALRAAAPAAAVHAAGQPLSAEQFNIVASLDKAGEALRPSPASIPKEQRERTHLASLIALGLSLWLDYYLAPGAWNWNLESLGFMLIGMALYRTGVSTGTAPSHA